MNTRIVYLDRNVLGDLRQEMIYSTASFNILREAVRSGIVTIPISFTVLEESLPVIKTNSAYKIESDVFITRELLDWSIGIKPHVELLYEDVLSYARGLPLPPRGVMTNLQPEDIFTPNAEKLIELDWVVDKTAQQTAENLEGLRMAKQAFIHQFAEDGRIKFDKSVTFPNIWKASAPVEARNLAKHLGVLRECEKQGIDGLLNIRTVRLYIGYGLSFGYGKFVLREKLTRGDSRDHHHAVLASVASIFVTHDAPFARLLQRIPIDDFHVTSLDGIVDWLQCRKQFPYWDYLDSGFKMPKSRKERRRASNRK